MNELSVTQRIHKELNRAWENQDHRRVAVLETVLADLRDYKKELGRKLSINEERSVLYKAFARRERAAEEYQRSGKIGLVRRAKEEADIILSLLPPHGRLHFRRIWRVARASDKLERTIAAYRIRTHIIQTSAW